MKKLITKATEQIKENMQDTRIGRPQLMYETKAITMRPPFSTLALVNTIEKSTLVKGKKFTTGQLFTSALLYYYFHVIKPNRSGNAIEFTERIFDSMKKMDPEYFEKELEDFEKDFKSTEKDLLKD